MKIKVNAVHFNADDTLVDFIQKKLNKIDTFYDRITSGEVFLRLDKGDTSKIKKKYIEIKLNVPGSTIFVKEAGDSFEEATDLAMGALTKQVIKFKEKNNIVEHQKAEVGVPEPEDVLED